jgi:hypothetical protein
MNIITDNKSRPFLFAYEVPQKILEEQFDWLTEENTDGFFKYLNGWYHISEFMVVDPKTFGGKWRSSSPNGFFSGVLLNVSDDGEEYVVGRYMT